VRGIFLTQPKIHSHGETNLRFKEY
jgi:hypothetical protein